MREKPCPRALSALIFALVAFETGCSHAPALTSSGGETDSNQVMDHDLMEVTIPQLEQLYASHKYTVTEVVRWHMARINKYNRIYRAVQNLDAAGALKTATQEDADAKAGGEGFCAWPFMGCADRHQSQY